MPSFATLFVAATAAFAAFASAAPMPDTGLDGATGSIAQAGTTTTNSLGGINQVAGGVNHRRAGDAASVYEQIKQSIGNGAAVDQGTGDVASPDVKIPPTPTNRKRGDTPSLPEILLKVKAQVVVLSDRLHRIIVADAKVDVKILLPILDELCHILGEAVLEVKALAGLSIDVVLRLHGSVIAVVDCAKILAAVLAIVWGVLGVCIQAVVSADHAALNPSLALVANVTVELLAAAFVCVHGLLPALVPLCDTIISLTRVWGFANVLAVLKV